MSQAWSHVLTKEDPYEGNDTSKVTTLRDRYRLGLLPTLKQASEYPSLTVVTNIATELKTPL